MKNKIFKTRKKDIKYNFSLTETNFKRYDEQKGKSFRNNTLEVNVSFNVDLLINLKSRINKGETYFEIRPEELFLKGKHEVEVYEKMLELHAEDMDSENTKSDEEKKAILDKGVFDLQEYVYKNHFIHFEDPLFVSNEKDIFIKYDHKKKELTIYKTKIHDNGSKKIYYKSCNGSIVKQFRRLILDV